MNARWVRPVTLLLCGLALVRAAIDPWMCDDAFISFRYADHLVDGSGLVWNPGERVEGITNLLWTLIIALFRMPGFDPVHAAALLGTISFAAALWALYRVETARQRLPVATWVFSLLPAVITWAGGGLETMMFTAAPLWIAERLFSNTAPARREWQAGAFGGALLLIRPDGALIAGVLALLYAWTQPARVKSAVRVLLPIAVAQVAVTAFRLGYYGDWLPNTFYAKSASDAYWGQGFTYVALLLAHSPVLALLLLLWLVTRLSRPLKLDADDALAITALVFVAYVVRSGGDYMHARRLIPAVPFLLVAWTAPLGAASGRLAKAATALACAAAAISVPIFSLWGEPWGHSRRIGYITDEHGFWSDALLEQSKAQGADLHRVFDGLDARFFFEGGLCIVAYYSNLPVFIEGHGITDKHIARQPLAERGRPGHERLVDDAYLDARGVQLKLSTSGNLGSRPFDAWELQATKLLLRARYYDDALTRAALARGGVSALTADKLLIVAGREIGRSDCEHARETAAKVSAFLRAPTPELVEAAAARCPQ
jgi:hypothetical protein